MIMTHSALAQMLEGHNAEDKFTKYVNKIARDNRLVILTTVGDDVLKFTGFFNDEADCMRGGDVHLRMEGEECWIYTKPKESTKKITSFWEEHRAFTWKFLTNIPHSKFCVRKGGRKWCEAIVFSVDELINISPLDTSP
jgi:hypothetical protein